MIDDPRYLAGNRAQGLVNAIYSALDAIAHGPPGHQADARSALRLHRAALALALAEWQAYLDERANPGRLDLQS